MMRFLRSKGVRFVALFFLLFGVLYVVNYVLMGVMIPGGDHYVPWVHNNLNYIEGMRTLLLNSTSAMLNLLGFYNIQEGNILWVKGGHNIRLMYSCLGLNVLFMWWAFVISFPRSFVQKVIWFIGGTILLVIINIGRLTLLTACPDNVFDIIGKIDHHNLFNIVSYGLILVFMKISIDSSMKQSEEHAME